SFDVRIAVLRNDRSDTLRMLQRDPQADGSPVIKDIDREAFQSDHVGEAINRARQIIKGVFEILARKQVGTPEAGQIWRYKMKPIREKRDQIAEHMACARKTMQEQDCRRLRRAGFAIRNLETINSGGAI